MEEKEITKSTTQGEIVCKNCSAKLTYAPGTNNLKCQYCGVENEIVSSGALVEELDFERFISEFNQEAEKHDVVTVKCNACGAQTSFGANIVSDSCAFCGSPIVVSDGTVNHSIQPQAVLPFLVEKNKATGLYSSWLNKLWWAPSDLKKLAQQEGKLIGIYIPYWTYDANTDTSYSGERGEDYTETEEYETVENGETVTRTRTIVRTVWYPVSGEVNNVFDDVLVNASNSLPREYSEKLEPWDLNNLMPFNPSYLSGYKAESYQIDLRSGFDQAKEKMDKVINQTILNAIGGAHQRVFFANTAYNNITFKHILLPIWISAYRYNNKTYRFMINGRTGDVRGQRPYSWMKITLAILIGITVLALLFVLL
jgi:LSD1 subclass zinc finger protein